MVTLLTCIQEVSGSNLGQDIDCPGSCFMLFMSLSRQMPGQYINWTMATSFHSPSSSVFIAIVPLNAAWSEQLSALLNEQKFYLEMFNSS